MKNKIFSNYADADKTYKDLKSEKANIAKNT